MKKKKIASIILGISIIIIAIIMPFHLKEICYEFSHHPEWSLGSCGAIHILALSYSGLISILALILLLLNVSNEKKKQ